MNIRILGTESLGVRGLACIVESADRNVVIDPGISLGWMRHGLLPHPFQIAAGVSIRALIIQAVQHATDIVISHFHGDHCPLSEPNPYQLGLGQVEEPLSKCRIWAKGDCDCHSTEQARRLELAGSLGRTLRNPDGMKDDMLEFAAAPHGRPDAGGNTVMLTRIAEKAEVFVHASDIQFLDEQTIERILDWSPTIVLASGPPLYRFSSSFGTQSHRAWDNALRLSRNVKTVVIDHHLLRSDEGIKWLRELSDASANQVLTAAGFMKRQPILLEAWRRELYGWLPVEEHWHDKYRRGEGDLSHYRVRGWEALMEHGKIKPCKWYSCCPIRRFTEDGKLERYWVENYCLVGNRSCVRYQKEERGEYHPGNMLPNGEICGGLG